MSNRHGIAWKLIVVALAIFLVACGTSSTTPTVGTGPQVNPAPHSATNPAKANLVDGKKSPEAKVSPKAVPVETPRPFNDLTAEQVAQLALIMKRTGVRELPYNDQILTPSDLMRRFKELTHGGTTLLWIEMNHSRPPVDCSTLWMAAMIATAEWSEGMDFPRTFRVPVDQLDKVFVEIHGSRMSLRQLMDWIWDKCPEIHFRFASGSEESDVEVTVIEYQTAAFPECDPGTVLVAIGIGAGIAVLIVAPPAGAAILVAVGTKVPVGQLINLQQFGTRFASMGGP